MEGSSRKLTLYDQMTAADGGGELEPAGGTIDGVLAWEKRASPPRRAPSTQLSSRTLLDVIRDEPNAGKGGAGDRDKTSWKSFRDCLRLKRAGAAWTSSVPTTDLSSFRSQISRRCSSRYGPNAVQPSDSIESEDYSSGNIRGTDAGRVGRFRHQMSRHNSTRFSQAMDDNTTDPTEPARERTRRLSVALAEERELSAREAVAAQEAAEAEVAAIAVETMEEEEEESNEAEPEATQAIRMSLMDLLEETDRQMGLVGARYGLGGEEGDEEEEEEEEEEDKPAANGGRGPEYTCCVCMVRHKGSAFIPCGHTFCRLCSRELWLSRGNCPLCNSFILEILDIF